LETDPVNAEALRLRAHIWLQFHRFEDTEAAARVLVERHGQWFDHMLLGDALMEQGQLKAAATSYEAAMDQRPGLPLYDRVSWMRWLLGDLPGAVQVQIMAVKAGHPSDPEPLAWVLTRLGWLHALQGKPSPEFRAALGLLPDYAPARFHRGLLRLHQGDTQGASEDLKAAGRTVEAYRARAEFDDTVDVEAVRTQDPRGFGTWLADREPERAIGFLEAELRVRQDAVTRMALAYARHRAGQDTTQEARSVLETGIIEPRTLLQAGLILGDRALLDQALSMGPGLLPSERVLAEP
jgi:tetratricopeptide (TPR) repeat protein